MPDDVIRSDPEPVRSIHDPRAIQILSAEHFSLLSARSLAYTEAFTRGGMFLAFLSMSFVALALLANSLPGGRDLLLISALVLAFDFVVGVMTYGRIIGAHYEDYRALHGMARIRHGYGEIAPVLLPYFTDATHDDLAGVMVSYGSPPTRGRGAIVYQLTTSSGLINLIVSMIGGVLALVLSLIAGVSITLGFVVAAVTAAAVFLVLLAMTVRFFTGVQVRQEVLFPTPPSGA